MSVISVEFEAQVASNPSNTSINGFQRYFADDSLILRPAFQRNLVWNKQQQSFLIDSILRGLPVPEVYVQKETSADGDERILVVDGQQRISACLKFLAGELRLTGDDDLDPRWSGLVFSELADDLKKRFRSYQLVVRELPVLEDPVLREVFRRLNKTVEPLQAQELRHAAYTGPFIHFVELAASHPALSEIGVFTARDYLRRKSDELVGEIAFAIHAGAFPNKKEGLDDLFLLFERERVHEAALTSLERRLGRVLQQLAPMAVRLRRTRFRNKSDFYSLAVLLARHAEHLPLNEDLRTELCVRLVEFSELVNGIKRAESGEVADVLPASADGAPAERVAAAASYLRAVERAASDRLSRVKRDQALTTVLAEILERGTERALTEDDSVWVHDLERATDAEEDKDDGDAKDAAQAAIGRGEFG